ncbi:hypothetical protein SLS55_003159 [Diplodia seriata]|uniref:Uncharacterized protein n=1 Tax=Diplodia seriata TaxID=420778 RepID=A0ABR3CQH5_9PEZI
MANLIHAISKHDNSHHAVFPVPENNTPLAPNSVRVRTTLITLSSNNLTYARLGTTWGWWTAYPVPTAVAPPPYNDGDAWGIVPAWGYATVVASTIAALPADGTTTIYGYWPTTSHAVDLQLQPAAGIENHWIETSPHRQALMNMYNRYVPAPIPSTATPAAAAATARRVALKPVWECGYLFSRFNFPPAVVEDDSGSRLLPVHPLGLPAPAALPWTARDADLRRAVVVGLAATSKTGRGFAWSLLRDRKDGGPLAVLQATSAPGKVRTYDDDVTTARKNKAVGYGELNGEEGVGWVLGFKPERVVVIDFGTRDGVLEGFVKAVEKEGKGVEVLVVLVGAGMKVYSEDEMKADAETAQRLKSVQFNTSTVRDWAMEIEGPEAYFAKVNEAWERCEEEGGMGEFEAVWVDGVDGIEKAWQDLCDQKVKPDEAIVVRV